MEDPEEEDIWVEFMMVDSGVTSTDDTIALSALLIDMFDMEICQMMVKVMEILKMMDDLLGALLWRLDNEWEGNR